MYAYGIVAILVVIGVPVALLFCPHVYAKTCKEMTGDWLSRGSYTLLIACSFLVTPFEFAIGVTVILFAWFFHAIQHSKKYRSQKVTRTMATRY